MGLPVSQIEWKPAPDPQKRRLSFPVRLSRRFLTESHSVCSGTHSASKRWKRNRPVRSATVSASSHSTPCKNLKLSGNHTDALSTSSSSKLDLSKLSQQIDPSLDADVPSRENSEENESIWTVSSYSTVSSTERLIDRDQLHDSQSTHGQGSFQHAHSLAESYFDWNPDKYSVCSASSSRKWISREEFDDAYAVTEQLVESIARGRIRQLRSDLKHHFNEVAHLLPTELCEVHGSFSIHFPGGGRATYSYYGPPLHLKPVVYESEAFPRVGVVRLQFDMDTLQRVDRDPERLCRRVYFGEASRQYSSANIRVSTPEVGYDIDRLLPSFPDVFTPDTQDSNENPDRAEVELQNSPSRRTHTVSSSPKQTLGFESQCGHKRSALSSGNCGDFSTTGSKTMKSLHGQSMDNGKTTTGSYGKFSNRNALQRHSVAPPLCLKTTTV